MINVLITCISVHSECRRPIVRFLVGSGHAKIEKLTSVASLVNVHHLTARGLVSPVLVKCNWVGYHVYLWHGTSVWCQFKIGPESGPVQQI